MSEATQDLLSWADVAAKRDQAIARHALKKTGREFLQMARQIGREISNAKGHVTVDDIRKELDPPAEADGRIFGAIFKGKEWQHAGYEQSRRGINHGRPIARFVYVGERA